MVSPGAVRPHLVTPLVPAMVRKTTTEYWCREIEVLPIALSYLASCSARQLQERYSAAVWCLGLLLTSLCYLCQEVMFYPAFVCLSVGSSWNTGDVPLNKEETIKFCKSCTSRTIKIRNKPSSNSRSTTAIPQCLLFTTAPATPHYRRACSGPEHIAHDVSA